MRSIQVLSLILVLFSPVSCGRGVLPGFEETLDRVDSLTVALDAGALDMGIYSSSGIGSCLIVFDEPLNVGSVRIRLMYESGRDYSVCENLEIVVRYNDSGRESLFSDQIRLEEGYLVLPLAGSLEEISLFWIDYYRS